jgi:hypothetical protein
MRTARLHPMGKSARTNNGINPYYLAVLVLLIVLIPNSGTPRRHAGLTVSKITGDY